MNWATLYYLGIGIILSSLFLHVVNIFSEQIFDASTDTGVALALAGSILGMAVMVCGILIRGGSRWVD